MIGKNRTIYCLMKYVIFTIMAMGALGLALLSADEIEVVPPDFLPSNEITVASPGTPRSDLSPATDVPHHGEIVDTEGKAEDCLQCHENKNIRSHKILIQYPPPYRGPEVTFRPLQDVLALGMKFEDGMITCITCHDLTNETRFHLAHEPQSTGHAQKLCYVCHMEID